MRASIAETGSDPVLTKKFLNMEANGFYGIDASVDISLNEYGLLVKPYKKDGRKDEYFIVYKVQHNLFDTGCITEEAVNGYITGKEFPSQENIASFLSFVGQTSDEWLNNSFVTKLSDLLIYWGYENIMGTSSYTVLNQTEVEAIIARKG